jgi:hypothetical protein
MSYLLDRKTRKRKNTKIVLFAILIIFVVYFRTNIFNGLSYATHIIFRPVIVGGNNIGEKLGNIKSFFYSKKSLFIENQDLKSKLGEKDATLSNYNSILVENEKLKEILLRKNENASMILSAILSKPNKSPYDTLVIDVGGDLGIFVGDKVFALGNIPIGRVAEVYASTSKVILYSNPSEKTEVIVSVSMPSSETLFLIEPINNKKDIFLEAIGRGGGNFEMILPRDFVLEKGTEIQLPGITPFTLGTVSAIISDPRDAFTKALLVSPVNIQELKFVQVQK